MAEISNSKFISIMVMPVYEWILITENKEVFTLDLLKDWHMTDDEVLCCEINTLSVKVQKRQQPFSSAQAKLKSWQHKY